MNEYILRVAPDSRGYFTRGKVYELISHKVFDDGGIIRTPRVSNPKFWASLGRHESQFEAESTACLSPQPVNVIRTVPLCPPASSFTGDLSLNNHTHSGVESTTNNEETIMNEKIINIKTITYVNDVNVTELSTNCAVALIRKSKARIDELEEVKALGASESEFLEDQIKKESNSLAELIAVLDKTVDTPESKK